MDKARESDRSRRNGPELLRDVEDTARRLTRCYNRL